MYQHNNFPHLMPDNKAIDHLNAPNSPHSSDYTRIDALPTTNDSSGINNEGLPANASGKSYENIAIWITVTLLATVGLVATGMHFYKHHYKPQKEAAAAAETSPAPAAPVSLKTEWDSRYTTNTDRVSEKCMKLVSDENTYTVFSHGTCVRVVEPSKDPVKSAKSTLQIIADPSLPYTVQALDNNNYIVVFNNYVFCWLFAEDIAANKKAILADSRFSPTLMDVEEGKMTSFEHRLGKLARILVIADSHHLKEKKLIRSSSAHAAGSNTTDISKEAEILKPAPKKELPKQ